MRSLFMATAGTAAMLCGIRGPQVCFAPPSDDGEPIGIISLEDNLSDVEKPPEVPAGRYKAEVQDVQLPTSQKGNQYFAVKFVIPSEELPADVRESYPDGAILYHNRVIVPDKGNRRALYNLKQFVEALGLDSNTTEIDPNQWMGQEATLVVRMGKYQGEERAEIGAVLPAEAARSRSSAAPADAGAKGKAAPAKRRGR